MAEVEEMGEEREMEPTAIHIESLMHSGELWILLSQCEAFETVTLKHANVTGKWYGLHKHATSKEHLACQLMCGRNTRGTSVSADQLTRNR